MLEQSGNGGGRDPVGPSVATAAGWDPVARMGTSQAVDDHECNPEYEVHLGRIVETDEGARRYASVWLRGRRFHGWLVAGEPDRVAGEADVRPA
jgi:hypothetical protein